MNRNFAIKYLIFVLVVCSCHTRRYVLNRPTSFGVVESRESYFISNDKQELAYVFEVTSCFIGDSLIKLKGVLYKDMSKVIAPGDSLGRGIKDVRVLLLKYGNSNELYVHKDFGKTNCYGGFGFSYNPKNANTFCVAFLKDTFLNTGYDVQSLMNSRGISPQSVVQFKLDTLCH